MQRKLSVLIGLVIFLSACKKDPEPQSEAIIVNNFVNARNYRKLVVEIISEKGMSLQAGTIEYVRKFLEKTLDKPGGIEIVQKEISSPGKTVYSLSELQELEKLNRGAQTSGETATAFIYVANAGYSESAAVLGLAYQGSSIILFEKVMRQHSGGLGQVPLQTVESAVLAHEFGHVMGLVNNGISMVDFHQDEQNGRHCNNKNCLMYYATETTDLLCNLLGSSVPELDAACLADIQKEKSR